jgi:hypothetical protein
MDRTQAEMVMRWSDERNAKRSVVSLARGIPFGMIHVGPGHLLQPVPAAPLFTNHPPWPYSPCRFVGWDNRRGVPRYRVQAGRR